MCATCNLECPAPAKVEARLRNQLLHYATFTHLVRRAQEIDSSPEGLFQSYEMQYTDQWYESTFQSKLLLLLQQLDISLGQYDIDLRFPCTENQTLEYTLTARPVWVINSLDTGVVLDESTPSVVDSLREAITCYTNKYPEVADE